jgi:uroporphyrinogen-III synthase
MRIIIAFIMLSQRMKYLHHKRILLTRTAQQNQHTAALVSSLGATPVLFPCNVIQALPEQIHPAWQSLQQQHSTQTDIIFSSQNGVEAVAGCVTDFAKTLSAYRVIAVGQKTAASLKTQGVDPTWVAKQASQQGLIQDYPKHGLPKQAYFFRATVGSDALVDFLATQQVPTTLVSCYQTVIDEQAQPEVLQDLKNKQIDAVLLGSARTAEFYRQKVGDLSLANTPAIAVMSPHVRKAADKLGLNVQVIAKEPSFEAMLLGLNDYFATQDNKEKT